MTADRPNAAAEGDLAELKRLSDTAKRLKNEWSCSQDNELWASCCAADRAFEDAAVNHVRTHVLADPDLPAPTEAREALEETSLVDSCKPWEFHVGAPPPDDSPLSAVFGAGMSYTEGLLAKELGVENYEPGDGSENFDNDATKTLTNILTAAGLYDEETGRYASLARPASDPAPAAGERVPVGIDYTNYRGERTVRIITPWSVEWGSSEFHQEPQWLLTGYDHDKRARRTYALRDIHAWNGVPTESPVAVASDPTPAGSGFVTVPEGWRLVPEEPTEGMDRKGRYAGLVLDDDRLISPANIYRAMLAVAPSPQADVRADAGERDDDWRAKAAKVIEASSAEWPADGQAYAKTLAAIILTEPLTLDRAAPPADQDGEKR